MEQQTEHRVIVCPWCREVSHFDLYLPKYKISQRRPAKDLAAALAEEPDCPRVLKCQNPDCWAPFEAVLCYSVRVARALQKELEKLSWATPLSFFLRMSEKGPKDRRSVCVAFNRNHVRRWKRLLFSELMDPELLKQSVLGFSVTAGVPLTAFEAFHTPDKLFWIPLEPDGGVTRNLPYSTEICEFCRQRHRQEARKELLARAVRGELGEHCPYYSYCGYGKECQKSQEGPSVNWRTCLLRLDLWEEHDPCYRSDLEIIGKLTKRFQRSVNQEIDPENDTCWCGRTEIVFPVIAQNHLVAVLMTGRFPTRGSAATVDEILSCARRFKAARAMPHPDLLEPHRQELGNAVNENNCCSTPAQIDELTSRDSRLRRHATYLAQIIQHRINQKRNVVEGMFRDEIGGLLGNWLSDRRDILAVVPEIQQRMLRFWAFERGCILMGPEWEDSVRLYAVDGKDVTARKVTVDLSAQPSGWYLLEPNTITAADGSSVKDVRTFVDELGRKLAESCLGALDLHCLTLVVFVRRQDRRYVFLFSERTHSELFHIPVRGTLPKVGDRDLRLSNECRNHVRDACQSVADQVQHFWYADDLEQSFRALAHTLRNPMSYMQSGFWGLVKKLKSSRELLRQQWPGMLSAVQDAVRGMSISYRVLDGELEKYRSAEKLESFLAMANDGTTDLCKVLGDLRSQYDFIAKRTKKTWNLSPALPDEVRIDGKPDAIILAIRNVAENAYKYGVDKLKTDVELVVRDGEVSLTIRNTGVLIEQDELGKIVQKGYRGRHARTRKSRNVTGTGLGMYLVKRVMDAVEGQLAVSCAKLNADQGQTTVSMTFRLWHPDTLHGEG